MRQRPETYADPPAGRLGVVISHPATRRYAFAFAGYAIATLIIFFPLIRHLNGAVLWQPGDQSSTARDMWAAEQQGESPFSLTRDNLVFAPQGQSRAPALQIANAVEPSFAWTLGRPLGYLGALNLYMLLGFLLTGFVMFVLLDRLGLGAFASFVGGSLLAFNPWQTEQAFFGHSGLNHVWILPLVLLEYLWFRRAESKWAPITIGATLGFSFYLFSYLGLFTSFVLLVLGSVDALDALRRRRLLSRLPHYALVCAVAAAALIPAALAWKLRPAGLADSFATSKEQFGSSALRDYLLPSDNNPLVSWLFGDRSQPHVGEAVNFFGYTTIVLAVSLGAALAYGWRFDGANTERSLVIRFACILAPVGLLMSLPAYESIGSHRVPMPDAAYVLGTFVTWWKAYNRFGILVGFALAILAAVALHAMRRTRSGRIASLVVVALAVIELLPGTPVPTWRLDRASAATQWLKAHPGGIVATYPMVTSNHAYRSRFKLWSALTWERLYDQTRHGHPLYAVQSLPADESPTIQIRLATQDISLPSTARLLRGQGVRYVVVDLDAYAGLRLPAPRPAPRFVPVASFGRFRIYRVTGPSSGTGYLFRPLLTPGLTLGTGFGAEETYNGEPARWMTQDGVVVVDNPNRNGPPVNYALTVRGFGNANQYSGDRRLELIDATGKVFGKTSVQSSDQDYTIAPVHLPYGRSRLRLHVTPGPRPLGGADTRRGSIFVRRVTIGSLGRYAKP